MKSENKSNKKSKSFLIIIILVISILIICGIVFFILLNKPHKFLMETSNFKKDQDISKIQSYKQTIEKNIFQTWSTKDLPKKYKKITDYLKAQNPEYTYHIYDDKDLEEFIKTHYPEYLEYYLSINPEYGPARADFARYLLIYHYGGVYFDIKSGCNKPLRKIINPDDEIVVPEWNKVASIFTRSDWPAQWVIIGKSKNKLLKMVIEEMINRIRQYNNKSEVGAMGVFKLTGPFLYKDIVLKYISKQNIFSEKLRVIKSPNQFVYSWMDKNDMDWFKCGWSILLGNGNCKHQLNKKEKRYTNKKDPIVINSSTKAKAIALAKKSKRGKRNKENID